MLNIIRRDDMLALSVSVPATRWTFHFGCAVVIWRGRCGRGFMASASINECPFGADPAYPDRLRYRLASYYPDKRMLELRGSNGLNRDILLAV